MKIDTFVLGVYETNCYILRSSETATDCLIIDTGLNATKIVDFLKQSKLNPIAVILTHGHMDHIAGLNLLRETYPETKVYIHKFDAPMLEEPQANLSAAAGIAFTTTPADHLLEDTATIAEAAVNLTVIHTPGHTPGGICLYSKDHSILFSGDTLFTESVGRTDFPGGSMPELIQNIKDKLLVLPEETKVYPGHGPVTTIAHEKNHNPFLQ